MIAYVNGEYKKGKSASLPLDDVGILRGYGACGVLRTYGGAAFHLHDHICRLNFSLELLEIPLVLKTEEILIIIKQLMFLNQMKDVGIKMLVTGGHTDDGLLPVDGYSISIIVYPPAVYPEDFYEKGVKATTFRGQRFLPRCKSLNYTAAILALKDARRKDAFEALYISNDMRILEATTCNFFAFKGDKLITPHRDVLDGITREVVFRISKNVYELEKRDVYLDELSDFDEIFLSSSNKEILPVTTIDQSPIKDELVGPRTKKMIHLFDEYVKMKHWENLNIDFGKNSYSKTAL